MGNCRLVVVLQSRCRIFRCRMLEGYNKRTYQNEMGPGKMRVNPSGFFINFDEFLKKFPNILNLCEPFAAVNKYRPECLWPGIFQGVICQTRLSNQNPNSS